MAQGSVRYENYSTLRRLRLRSDRSQRTLFSELYTLLTSCRISVATGKHCCNCLPRYLLRDLATHSTRQLVGLPKTQDERNPTPLSSRTSSLERWQCVFSSLIVSVYAEEFLRVMLKHQLKSLLRNGKVVAVDVAEWRNSSTH